MSYQREALSILARGGPDALAAWDEEIQRRRAEAQARLLALPGSPTLAWQAPTVAPTAGFDASVADAVRADMQRERSGFDELLARRRELAELKRRQRADDAQLEALQAQLELANVAEANTRLDAAERFHPQELATWADQERNILGAEPAVRDLQQLANTEVPQSLIELARRNNSSDKRDEAVAWLREAGYTEPDADWMVSGLSIGDPEVIKELESRSGLAGPPLDPDAANKIRNALNALAWGGADAAGATDFARAAAAGETDPLAYLAKARAEAARTFEENPMLQLFPVVAEQARQEGVPFVGEDVAPWANELLMQRAAIRSGMDPRLAREQYPYSESEAQFKWQEDLFNRNKKLQTMEDFARKNDLAEAVDGIGESFLASRPKQEVVDTFFKFGLTGEDVNDLQDVLAATDLKASEFFKKDFDNPMSAAGDKFAAWLSEEAAKYLNSGGQKGLPPDLVGLLTDLYLPIFRRRQLSSPLLEAFLGSENAP